MTAPSTSATPSARAEVPTARPAAPPRPPLSVRDLEDRFTGRVLAWTGGVALVAAAIFFLSLAFSRGWIGEELRVLIGLVAGSAAFALGGFTLIRGNALIGNVLAGVGVGVVSIALMAATRIYDLVPPEVGLAGALVVAIAAAALAIRCDSVVVAVFGLVAALIAPPLLGAAPNLVTLGFVAVLLAGTTTIALFRSWRWLPWIAFVLAAPQLASWLGGDPDPAQALVALAGFWLVNVVAAAGEEVRVRRDVLAPSSATLVLVNAAYLLWGGFTVLAGDLEPWRGAFLAAGAVAHLVVGGWFLRDRGLEHLFGNLVAGTGVAFLTMAAFVQLGAPLVPLAWAAEAVALTWLAVRRVHRWSALVALALAGLVLGHLVLVEYPLWEFDLRSAALGNAPLPADALPTLAAVLGALALALALVPVRWVRSALVGAGVILAAYGASYTLAGPWFAAALAILAVAALLLDVGVARMDTDDRFSVLVRAVPFPWFASLATLVVGLLALGLVFVDYPAAERGTAAAEPFLHPETATLAIVLAGMAASGGLVAVRAVRSALAGAAVLLLTYALGFEVELVWLVALTVVLLPAGVAADLVLARLPDGDRFAPLREFSPVAWLGSVGGVVAWVAAAGYAVSTFLPLDLWGRVAPPAIPFSDDRALVGALLVAAVLAAGRLVPFTEGRLASVLAAVAVTAWVIPFEVYADFVVVLWCGVAVLGVLAFAWTRVGLRALAGAGAVLAVGAMAVAYGIVATPDHLVVVDPTVVSRSGLVTPTGWPFAFAALAATLYAAPRLVPLGGRATWVRVGAGVTVVYALSIAVVDVFQRRAGGDVPIDELMTQAQVALSILWTALGVAALVAGLIRRVPVLRHAGLALLGLATAKVFIVDLAAMDVAYRALVLAGLGVLLLAGAWLYTHYRGPRAGPTGIPGGRPLPG